jgi:bifunctional non-homologous end joining protein LigD
VIPSRDPAARLARYQERRHFERTPEPSGREASRRRDEPIFVVQKHAARRLHYDFRLEIDGVLVSWSVPKGPSLKAGARRLAVRTEDHPLDYADFEGVIPKGEYGGGTVIIWDHGTWCVEGDAHTQLEKGRLTFELEGQKLHGRFHLVRTRPGDNKRENWLLFKGRDAAATPSEAQEIVESAPGSVVSGLPLEEVARAAGLQADSANRTPARAR